MFYSEELVGMQAWTEAYMGTKLTSEIHLFSSDLSDAVLSSVVVSIRG